MKAGFRSTRFCTQSRQRARNESPANPKKALTKLVPGSSEGSEDTPCNGGTNSGLWSSEAVPLRASSSASGKGGG
eukprot:4920271-Amphidinium_carterae.1